MKYVKHTVRYWCSETRSGKCLGRGVRLAVLDSGIADHPDLKGRIRERMDFAGAALDGHNDGNRTEKSVYDESGHGTHVAGIIAGNGMLSGGLFAGMAPESEIISGRVLDAKGNGSVDNVVRGIEWVLHCAEEKKIRIVNISVGTQPDLAQEQKQRLLDAVDALWDAGLIVVVSAGNYGPAQGSVVAPGSSKKVITVGVPDRKGGKGVSGPKKLNYSGRGPTAECVVKPDLFAPGTGIVSCSGRYGYPGEDPYTVKSGTSMAAPVVSGAIACLLSKEPSLTNAEIKLKLRQTCNKREGTEAGWGLLNVAELLK